MQVGAVKYLDIYASFAVLPIMLYWMYMSWEILLFGAEVAFAIQNCSTYRMETRAHDASARSRLSLALSIVKEAAKSMTEDAAVVEIGEYAREHQVPVRLVIQVINELVHAGMLAELAGKPGSFVLLKSPETVSVNDIVGVILDSGSTPSDLGLLSPDRTVEEALQKADAGLEKEVGSISLKALAAQ
jgi:membrane protein